MTTASLIGVFDAADNATPTQFVVDTARGYFYGVDDNGIQRLSYPGLVNTEGAGNYWFAASDRGVGLTLRPSDGHLIYAEVVDAIGGSRSYYRINTSGTSFLIASPSDSGVSPSDTRLAWSPAETTAYGLLMRNPVRLLEVDVGGSSVSEVTSFTGMTFAGHPHITPDGAIWWVATVSGSDVVFRYDPSTPASDSAAVSADNYGFGRCDNTFWVPTAGVWEAWDSALSSSSAGFSPSFDPTYNHTTFTDATGNAWLIQYTDTSDIELWYVPCGGGNWSVGRVRWPR